MTPKATSSLLAKYRKKVRWETSAAAAIWYGAREIAAGTMTTGDFSSFLATAFMMYGPVKKLSRVNANLQQTIAASER